MTELQAIIREIDKLIIEKDDFIEITSLTTSNAWEALVRKMDASEEMQMEALLVTKEPQEVHWLQGFVAGFRTVKQTVAGAREETKTIDEEITLKQAQKDELLDHQE